MGPRPTNRIREVATGWVRQALGLSIFNNIDRRKRRRKRLSHVVGSTLQKPGVFNRASMGLRPTHIDEDLWGQRFHAAAALPGGVLFPQEHGNVSNGAEI